jgi:hypothetical protein
VKAAPENTRFWHLDGPTEFHNSMTILLGWLTTHGNYCKWRGGDKHNGVTKKTMAGDIAATIKAEINVHRSAKNVQNKIELLESQFKKASDWLNQTGAGCTEGEIKDYIVKLCPYYYELRDIMNERHTTKPLDVMGSSIGGELNDGPTDSLSNSDDESKTIETQGSKRRIVELRSPSASVTRKRSKAPIVDYGSKLVELKREQLDSESKSRERDYILKKAAPSGT